jgi:hypothetical protein
MSLIPAPELVRDFIAEKPKQELIDIIMQMYRNMDANDTLKYFELLLLDYNGVNMSLDDLTNEIKLYDKESRKGKYYEDFDFGKKGVDYIPTKTREWFDRIGVLLDLLCHFAEKNKTHRVKALFDQLFDLISFMEESDEVVFAHEYGEDDIYCNYDYRTVYEDLVESLIQP